MSINSVVPSVDEGDRQMTHRVPRENKELEQLCKDFDQSGLIIFRTVRL